MSTNTPPSRDPTTGTPTHTSGPNQCTMPRSTHVVLPTSPLAMEATSRAWLLISLTSLVDVRKRMPPSPTRPISHSGAPPIGAPTATTAPPHSLHTLRFGSLVLGMVCWRCTTKRRRCGSGATTRCVGELLRVGCCWDAQGGGEGGGGARACARACSQVVFCTRQEPNTRVADEVWYVRNTSDECAQQRASVLAAGL